jgi:hypothetical protein
MIPIFLPCWESTVIRDAILGILLAAAALHAPEAGPQKDVAAVSKSAEEADTQPRYKRPRLTAPAVPDISPS